MKLNGQVRVLFIESGTELGGSQLALLNKLRVLDRSRIQPILVTLGFGSGNFPDLVEALQIRTYRLPAGRFRSASATIAKVREILRIAKREAVDLIFSNGGHSLLYARPAACLANLPCVWWVHGYLETDPMKGHVVPYLEQILQSDYLIANSSYTAGILHRVFPNRPPARVVPCGVDCERLAPSAAARAQLRGDLGFSPDEIVVGMFGRLHPFKGQHLFLRAAKQLRDQGLRPKLLFVGGTPYNLTPEYAAWVKAFAADLGLSSQTLFLGQRDDINRLYNVCDLVVHCSIEPEPWGQVVAEAMANGRSVIANSPGGPAEMIRHGENGWLTTIGDVEALARAIATLIADSTLRERLGANARRDALDKFDVRSTAQELALHLQRFRNN